MSDVVEELDNSLVVDWVRHPVTQYSARNMALEVENAMKRLVGYARNSTDPNVRGAVADLDQLKRFLLLLTTEPKEETEDERR